MLEQPTKLPLTANLGKRNRLGRSLLPAPSFREQQFVVLALVGSETVIIVAKDRAEMVQVPLAEDDKMIQQFLPQLLVEALYESQRVGRAISGFLDPQAGGLERGVELGGELSIPIVHYNVGTQAGLLDVFGEGSGLVADPGLVWKVRRRRQETAPAGCAPAG